MADRSSRWISGQHREGKENWNGVYRNLFNGDQYWDDLLKNPDRWFEAGVRIKF